MHKKILTEQAIYYGDAKMPEGWDLNKEEFTSNILESRYTKQPIKFSKNHDRLNNFVIEHIRLKHDICICQKETWGNIYKPKEVTNSLLEANIMDLKESPDFVLLYGIQVKDCIVNISYDDNRIKDKSWSMPLTNNKFIIFPSTNKYNIENNQTDSLNYIQVITYDLV